MAASSRSARREPILVLGGGPAGGAAAIGLARLGYEVTLVTRPRPFAAVEGISTRTLAGLRAAGFAKALQAVPEASVRQVAWNGQVSQSNGEHLVDRPSLDRGIQEDVVDHGVRLVAGRVSRVTASPDGFRVTVERDGEPCQRAGCFLVEARGRGAPSAGEVRWRGVESVCLTRTWRGSALSARSAVESFEDGWAWLATAPGGRRHLQLVLAAQDGQLPGRQGLAAFHHHRLGKLELAGPFVAGAEPCGRVTARASTPVACRRVVGGNWIRVGDAAMAVDPLSGNGIFQALSSALLAPAVVNTIMRAPDQAELAKRFYQERLSHLFLRFARIGRDFYRSERRWPERPFWRQRATWPDGQPVHPSAVSTPVCVAQRPVVQDGLIQERAVVITADQPLGVWHLEGIELAPVVQVLQRGELGADEAIEDQLQRRFGLSSRQAEKIHAWLLSEHLLSQNGKADRA